MVQRVWSLRLPVIGRRILSVCDPNEPRWAAFAAALIWVVAGAALIAWVYGGADARSFITPDEARERQAAERFAADGHIRLQLPADDPENILHPRGWSSDGMTATFVGPVVAPIIRGTLLRIPFVGDEAALGLSALGLGALAACGALIVSRRRLFFGLMLPLIAFPTTFWFVHYWMNLAVFNTFVAFAILCWVVWRRDGDLRWLLGWAAFLAIAVSVRPDYALYALLVSFLAGLSARLSAWRQITAVHFVTGASAVALVLAANLVASGDPLAFGYIGQRADRAEITGIDELPPLLDAARILISPTGVPSPRIMFESISRNFVVLAWPLLLTLVPATYLFGFRLRPRLRDRVIALGLVVAIASFAALRASPNLHGAIEGPITYQNSYVRYMSPAFLVIGLASLAGLAAMRRWNVAIAVIALVAGFGTYQLVAPGIGNSLTNEHIRSAGLELRARQIANELQPDSLILTCTGDKVLWHLGYAANIRDADANAVAAVLLVIHRERDAYLAGVPDGGRVQLGNALANQELSIAPTQVDSLWKVVLGAGVSAEVDGSLLCDG